MMRHLLIIFSVLLLGSSCAKRKTKNPVPVIVYKDLINAGKATSASQGPRDTAVIVLEYEDGDGDIFLDNTSQGPNVIVIPLFYNTTTNKFEVQYNPDTQDTARITASIKQPDNGYYKGKSIKGEIFIPMREFRPNDETKILKFTSVVVDVKGNVSNRVSSPVYTLNF